MKDPLEKGHRRLFLLITGTVWLLAASEWLFFVTKPSFLAALPWGSKVRLLLTAPLFPLIPALAIAFGLVGLRRFTASLGLKRLPGTLPAAVPAAVLTLTVMLLAENFTHTLFGFGIAERRWPGKAIYLALGASAFIYFHRRCGRWLSRRESVPSVHASSIAALALVVAAIVTTALTVQRGSAPIVPTTLLPAARTEKLPNILLIAADGIDARRLSLYGYPRETTPQLARAFSDSLIFENALSNGQNTTAAVLSMLTGKLPTTTRLIYSPHVLHGRHVFEHFPGILQRLGYHSFQETLRHFADALDQNMLSSFDMVNGRKAGLAWMPAKVANRFRSLGWERYFLTRTNRRISERVLHLLSISHLSNTYDNVRPFHRGTPDDDATRIDRSIAFLEGAGRPFFGHLHLLSSHCCTYTPSVRRFSARHPKDGIETKEEWLDPELQQDYFDDSILSADTEMGRLFQWLERHDELDDTLIVFSSDHSPAWKSDVRIPLLIRFPESRYSGRVHAPAQLLDVAPTLLDALGIATPDWMEGSSLLSHDQMPPDRPIFSVSRISMPNWTEPSREWSSKTVWGPPFYGIEAVSVSICGRFYEAKLLEQTVESTDISGWSLPCPPASLPTLATATEQIRLHLLERGF